LTQPPARHGVCHFKERKGRKSRFAARGRPISGNGDVSSNLVPLAPNDRSAPVRHPAEHPRADFLAQLIATVVQAPQTRLRRRAEPEEAIAAYGARGQWPRSAGRAVSRSL